jgi:hypothetical protein
MVRKVATERATSDTICDTTPAWTEAGPPPRDGEGDRPPRPADPVVVAEAAVAEVRLWRAC